MKTQVSKSQFKAKALEIFREVESSGESVIVTDHGTPSIEVRPFRQANRPPLEVLKGSVVEYNNPTDPVGDDEWEGLHDSP
ncbi:MAG: type II toxin-antitoxin system Phd/YefM family antitoxin [Thiohalomonadales bacterium]